ncbi:MAG: hypothetical protein H0T79_23680 [Deltaproteobacteria bacterium]|nr:hypothetical protein [Deltaproteobacteria bacterium]
MATFGIIELISLLLGLAGFGLQANPKAATADQALEYAIPDADVVMHFDAGSVIPNNYKLLTQLADQPQIKASPELSSMVRKAVNEVEGARGLAKSMTGIDLATDINDGTMFLKFVPQGEPTVVLSVHGKFSTATVDKIAGMTKKTVTKVGSGAMVDIDSNSAVGVTRTGTMIVGQPAVIKDRLADTWKAPARPANSNLAYAAEVLASKPVYAVVLTMSAAARAEAIKKIGNAPNFLTDIIQRHKVASFSLHRDGIGWTWIDNSKAGLEQIATMSEGTIELLRAAQIAPRAIAKLAMGGLESYRGTDKRIDELLRQKASLLKIMDSFSGDGSFKSAVDKNARALKLSVRLTGKTVSEVVPFGMVVPGMAFAFFGLRDKAPTSMPAPAAVRVPAPKPMPAPPRPSGGGLGKKPMLAL